MRKLLGYSLLGLVVFALYYVSEVSKDSWFLNAVAFTAIGLSALFSSFLLGFIPVRLGYRMLMNELCTKDCHICHDPDNPEMPPELSFREVVLVAVSCACGAFILFGLFGIGTFLNRFPEITHLLPKNYE